MLQNSCLFSDFIYKNSFCIRNIGKISLLNSLFISSFNEMFVNDIILLYFTYFFAAAKYPQINSIILRRAKGVSKKRLKNKSSQIYFSISLINKNNLISTVYYSFFLPFIKTNNILYNKFIFFNNLHFTNNFILFDIKNINLLLYSHILFLNNIIYSRETNFKFNLSRLNIYFNFYIIFRNSLNNK